MRCIIPQGLAAALIVAGQAQAAMLFSDEMNRANFDASSNGWAVQTYDKANSKGVYGRVPASVDNTTAMRYGVQAYSPTNIKETNTVVTSPSSFAMPTGSNYLEFAASLKINWSSAQQPGIVFGLSAYAANAAGQQDAVNMEFLTTQLNTNDTNGVSYDRIDLTSYNDYTATSGSKWFSRVESGVNSTNGYHTYAMRIFTNRVDYLVDGSPFATTSSVVPAGTPLKLVLVAWAPDATWGSATGTLPDTGFWYMDVNSVRVSTGTASGAAEVPEPSIAGLALVGSIALLRRRPHSLAKSAVQSSV